MKAKYFIGGAIIILFIIWSATAFIQTTVQYVSIAEARTADHTVQVMGKIDFDKVNYDAEKSRLEFVVYDADAPSKEGAATLDVVFSGVVPGNFDQATSVVLKGKTDGDKFVAHQMLVKCPSKYQGEGEEYQDAGKHKGPGAEAGA